MLIFHGVIPTSRMIVVVIANTPECIRVYNTHAILEFPHVRLLWPPALSVCQTPRWWIPRSRHWIYYGWFQFRCSNHKQRNSLLDCAQKGSACCKMFGICMQVTRINSILIKRRTQIHRQNKDIQRSSILRDNIDMFNTYYNTLSERESSCSIHHETECSGILEEFPEKSTISTHFLYQVAGSDVMACLLRCSIEVRHPADNMPRAGVAENKPPSIL